MVAIISTAKTQHAYRCVKFIPWRHAKPTTTTAPPGTQRQTLYYRVMTTTMSLSLCPIHKCAVGTTIQPPTRPTCRATCTHIAARAPPSCTSAHPRCHRASPAARARTKQASAATVVVWAGLRIPRFTCSIRQIVCKYRSIAPRSFF